MEIPKLSILLCRSGKKEEAELLFQEARKEVEAIRTAKPGETRSEGLTPAKRNRQRQGIRGYL